MTNSCVTRPVTYIRHIIPKGISNQLTLKIQPWMSRQWSLATRGHFIHPILNIGNQSMVNRGRGRLWTEWHRGIYPPFEVLAIKHLVKIVLQEFMQHRGRAWVKPNAIIHHQSRIWTWKLSPKPKPIFLGLDSPIWSPEIIQNLVWVWAITFKINFNV